jgi:hypothetical protein
VHGREAVRLSDLGVLGVHPRGTGDGLAGEIRELAQRAGRGWCCCHLRARMARMTASLTGATSRPSTPGLASVISIMSMTVMSITALRSIPFRTSTSLASGTSTPAHQPPKRHLPRPKRAISRIRRSSRRVQQRRERRLPHVKVVAVD